MGTHLVVLDRAVAPQSLRFGLLNFLSANKGAELVLLHVPRRLAGQTAEDARRVAREHAASTRSLLESMGIPVAGSLVGDPLPRKAIATEMRSGRHAYEGILLIGEPPGLLRLLQFDLASQLE